MEYHMPLVLTSYNNYLPKSVNILLGRPVFVFSCDFTWLQHEGNWASDTTCLTILQLKRRTLQSSVLMTFFLTVPSMWNCLPQSIVSVSSILESKTAFRSHLCPKYRFFTLFAYLFVFFFFFCLSKCCYLLKWCYTKAFLLSLLFTHTYPPPLLPVVIGMHLPV